MNAPASYARKGFGLLRVFAVVAALAAIAFAPARISAADLTEAWPLFIKGDFTHIPYKGTGPSLTALASGEVEFSFSNIPAAQPMLGRMRGHSEGDDSLKVVPQDELDVYMAGGGCTLPDMRPLPLLDALTGPRQLDAMDDTALSQLAEEVRYRIREVVSQGGGHLASNLGTVELTIALHRVFDFAQDRLLWDVGHQAYPHKLLTGRAGSFASNRQRGGLSGFPDPRESPYDLAKVGHSSTAISTGAGLAEADRRAGRTNRTVVVVGDGALTGGMAYEGLINAGDRKTPLIVVLNDNGNFIDPPVGSLHRYLDRVRSGRFYNLMRERFVRLVKRLGVKRMALSADHAIHKLLNPGFIFEDLGFRYFGPIDGHDLSALVTALRTLNGLKGPQLLHVITTKGKGYERAEDDQIDASVGESSQFVEAIADQNAV